MNTTIIAYCIQCLLPHADHPTPCDHFFVEMTLDRVDARKHVLEADERRDPNKDYSEEWERLAGMYKLLCGETPNYSYCLFQAQKNQPATDNDNADGYHFSWQDEANK